MPNSANGSADGGDRVRRKLRERRVDDRCVLALEEADPAEGTARAVTAISGASSATIATARSSIA